MEKSVLVMACHTLFQCNRGTDLKLELHFISLSYISNFFMSKKSYFIAKSAELTGTVYRQVWFMGMLKYCLVGQHFIFHILYDTLTEL